MFLSIIYDALTFLLSLYNPIKATSITQQKNKQRKEKTYMYINMKK